MAKILILLLLALGAAHAQQSSVEIYNAASKGDRTALKQLKARAEHGDAVAQFGLGGMYANGQAVPKDAVQAAAWYRKAAEQGYTEAQYELGWMYANGDVVPKDAVQAVAWYRKAAAQGDVSAQYSLGWMYAHGEGIPKDSAQAVAWYRKAAAQGFAKAQNALNAMEANSDVVPKAGEAGLALPPTNLEVLNAKRFVPMLQAGGVYVVPVLINGAIVLNFVVDSGAADVSIPADVVTTLMRAGTITQSDFIGTQTYTLADGSTTSSPTFRIRSLKVGDIVLQDVMGSVANREGDLLLGQSFLGRFKSWSIDNTKHALVLE
jgi:clan AA aspartic protease (TIGR02281 family)